MIAIEKSNFSRKKAKITVFDALGIIKSLKWGSEGSQVQFTWNIKATNEQRPCKRHSECFLRQTTPMTRLGKYRKAVEAKMLLYLSQFLSD